MGFLDIFKKKKENILQGETLILRLGGVEDFYRKKLAHELRESSEKAAQLQEQVLAVLGSVTLEPLERTVFEKDDKRYAAVNMSKNSYVMKMKTLLNSFPEVGSTYQDILDFQKKLGNIMTEIKTTTPKQVLALSNFFSKESNDIVQKVRKADSILKEFNNFLSQDKTLKFMHQLGNQRQVVLETLEKEAVLKKKVQSIEHEIGNLEVARDDVKKHIDALLKGEEWEQMENMVEDIEKTEQKLSNVRFRIQGELTVLKRPLKKAKHVIGKKSGLDNFISSPLKTFITTGGLEAILTIVHTLIDEGKISLKESEKQKIMSLKSRLEEMKKLKETHISLSDDIESKKKKKAASTLPEKKQELEEKQERLGADIKKMRNGIEQAKKNINILKGDVATAKEKMEKNIYTCTNDTITVTV